MEYGIQKAKGSYRLITHSYAYSQFLVIFYAARKVCYNFVCVFLQKRISEFLHAEKYATIYFS